LVRGGTDLGRPGMNPGVAALCADSSGSSPRCGFCWLASRFAASQQRGKSSRASLGKQRHHICGDC